MNNLFRSARYLTSAYQLRELPEDKGMEVAFVGRSNAGKSSAINALTTIRGLARTSKTPGRTQHIMFFTLGEGTHRRLVDLPGYGYAKSPDRLKTHWSKVLPVYLGERASLQGLVLVMDTRHPLKPQDWQMLDLCEHADLAVHVLLTKADKLTRSGRCAVLNKVRHELARYDFEITVQTFSSTKLAGIDSFVEKLNGWMDH